MLDHISISHQSGLVLWSRSFTPAFSALASSPNSPVNALVRSTFIEGKAVSNGEEEGLEKDGFSVRWTVENGLGLVFVVVFPALLPLAYIPQLLERTKALFLALFQPYIATLVESLTAGARNDGTISGIDASSLVKGQVIPRAITTRSDSEQAKKKPLAKHLAASSTSTPGTTSPETSDLDSSATPLSAEEIAKNAQAMRSKMKGGGKRRGLRDGLSPSPSPSPSRPNKSAQAKLMRKWGDSPVSKAEMEALDYSSPAPEEVKVDTAALVSVDALGEKKDNGTYEVADWDFKRPALSGGDLPSEEDILARRTTKLALSDADVQQSTWSNVFSRLTGSKTLSKDDLAPVLVEMEKHLMGKNVAKNIAENLCESVGAALVGKKLGGLSSVKSQVQAALNTSLTRVLTPKSSTDLLLDIQRKRSSHLSTLSTSDGPNPYTLTFVGVNGVGKSTNLSKVCFWLLQNDLRVLIAACDTFRSGAVEQLRVHVRNLGALGEEMGKGKGKRIELYERGYGKDAAGIAKDAIAYAKQNHFDVVLVDTAGRMQDNEPLMRALAKLVTVNNPDKIVFVGEALVGNEAVDQLSKFDRSLKDFSGAGSGSGGRKRGIDGIILTKFDTIDDKVGAALSMTYITGQPILFVGCGQTYTDLRQLKVNHIVQALLS
ncbi:hypothetical protein I350_01253 [Cryptococcus amylolentus CBS 6273]|uniref:SRP54-type proteins GTP-binding domain-containing protein n=1 Tax=Cryptococcus amylolentus CBS 6273 TaxID=1296118 RepID=A0A1E3KCH3_9TREE|nr:hypothetical protein I350_01253 [Cryptococcus amylolentus CBS 6273]